MFDPFKLASSILNQEPKAAADSISGAMTVGGSKSSVKSRYIKFLNKKYNLDEIRKICIARRIKVDKRYNGKKVFLKKASLLKKIADLKYPN